MEEGEVSRFWEARAENAIINHGEVERRNEEILPVKLVGDIFPGNSSGVRDCVIGYGELDLAAHRSVLVVMGVLKFCRHLHIKVCLK